MTDPEIGAPQGYRTLGDLRKPLRLDDLFSRQAPTELEIGCGRGDFLVRYAAARPDINILGVERKLTVLRRAIGKIRRAGIQNGVLLHAEIRYFLDEFVAPETFDAIHVYFPDPWPKAKHHKRRLFQPGIGPLLVRPLRVGGWLHFRTDDRGYFANAMAVLSAVDQLRPEPPPPDLTAVTTLFEDRFAEKGISALRASFRRVA